VKRQQATDALTEADEVTSTLFREWRERLLGCIGKISSRFGQLMKDCGYRGEVTLGFDHEQKLETYRLTLKVAFAAAEGSLRKLTSGRQSGGEKSVSTVLYLLALQDCTKFPFRVVDEINQGMDEVNDKSTFEKIVQMIISRPEPTQYFLVTPKMLENIELADSGVTVMVVMNGYGVDSSFGDMDLGFLS
jgi:chromosome segregation ATPase